MSIVGVMVSVNYDDYLKLIIENNSKIIDFVVVTTSTDIKTQELCKEYNITCLISDSCYDNGCRFNKSKMLNVGLRYVYTHYPDHYYLILDSDIYLNDNLLEKVSSLNVDTMYSCERYIVTTNYDKLDLVIKNPKEYSDFKETCPCKNMFMGFFQLFKNKMFYDERFENASQCDLHFSYQFKHRSCIDYYVLHIGPTGQNWFGRNREENDTN